jgi:sensor histidine kinase regulating citrate/malate metabolism
MDVINLPLLAISALTVLGTVVVNALVTYYGYEHGDRFYLAVVCMLIILACIFALCLQFGLLSRKNVQEELDTVKNMWQQEEKQYAMLKDNIDYINVKCHDLKHQIRTIGQNCSLDETSIREIQSVISIYDASLKTGNEALDVLLMEKNLTAHKKDIRLTCIADGTELGFMSDTDIYSLLGNAVDNAMEAVEKETDPEKRVVGLYIKTVGNFLSVHLYNYCAEPPVMADGLPSTSKQDKRVHGYGMKSMKMIAEKYGGELSVNFADNIFSLDILFPV